MPKMKTHSGSKKRFKITGTGKVKRTQAFKKHILTKKTAKRKRNLRKLVIASPANEANIKKMIPYM
jgi:large subunit ribosomal protein L35